MAATTAVLSAQALGAPLLMDGKQTLYQRVLTTPSCLLYPDGTLQNGQQVPAFSRYYVYERTPEALKVGPDTTGTIAGFLKSDCAVDWEAQTALIFTNPAGRDRTPIFDEREALQSIVSDKNPGARAAALQQDLQKDGHASHVIAQEPETYIDHKKNFYLLPILSSEESMFDDGFYTLELEVASVTKDDPKSQQPKSSQSAQIKAFKAALVFVIDSTISMQPYLDRTKKAIQTIYKRLEKEQLQDSVQFGLVSFRSSTKAVPGLEYVSRIFVKPGEANTEAEFTEKLRSLNQASVSSASFDEDSYAGVMTALNGVDWSGYGGRYIVLITDAGAITGSNKLSSTLLDSREIRVAAEQKGAAIYALHLLTDSGQRNNNHQSAAAQYKDLTFNAALQKPLYYPVNAGDVNSFGTMIDRLSDSIADQVKLAAQGKLSAGSPEQERQGEDKLAADTRLLGYAMQLAFLGSTGNTATPEIIRGWIADRDLTHHNLPTATPVVLLTKQQLSDLKDVTTRILDSANEGMLSPDRMFEQLRNVAASLGRDPSQLSASGTQKIAELGLLGEYLDDLPYKSRIQELDEDTWSSMGADEQNRTIEDLESKVRFYQQCNDDVDNWVSLTKGATPAEMVYAVPLEILP